MRRKGKKIPVVNEVKAESPKKSTRHSARQRKRSSSRSSNENEDLVQNPLNVKMDRNQIDSRINESVNQLENTSYKTKNDTPLIQPVEEDTMVNEKNTVEEENEENNKGKSTNISITNNDQSQNDIDPETENVQGSPPSPKDIDENVQIANENQMTNHENVDNEKISKEITKEEDITNETNVKVGTSNSNDNQQDTFQSEYATEKASDISQNCTNGEDQERSTTPELKPTKVDEKPEKKRITLKRSPFEKSRRPLSPLEDGEIQEPKEKSRTITLKRRTSDEKNTYFDKIIINRRSSTGDDKSDRRKRQGSITEENILTVVGKPNKSSKKVKLVRNFSAESSQDSITSQRNHKQSWGKTEFLDNLSSKTYKIDVDSIKIVCPTVEFLNESEVKLEEVPKERIDTESDVVKKREEEEQKSEEESEKERTDEENSAEEQKIEANPNIIALNRKISIVEDTAAKLRPPPSPPNNPPSEILYITNLVRPFTAKQLKELLERTGKIRENGFWTDRIKSKCYAQYEHIEEAETTRNALHGVYWPIGNGKQLVIDYATQEDMEKAKNPVPQPAPVLEKLPDKENREPEPPVIRHKEREHERVHDREERRRDTSGREWDKSRQEQRRRHSKSPSRSRERVRKHSRRSYTPEDINRKKHKNTEDSVPQKLMDDLFLKTKAMPSIYWQPLSPQEIATKQQQRLVRMEEHKRRVQENRGRRERDRRGSFRRR